MYRLVNEYPTVGSAKCRSFSSDVAYFDNSKSRRAELLRKSISILSITVAMFAVGCSRTPAESEITPPGLKILAPEQYLTDAELPLDVVVRKGTNDLGEVLVNVHGDSANYDTALTTHNTATAETLHVRPTFSRSGRYTISAQTTTADTTVRAQKEYHVTGSWSHHESTTRTSTIERERRRYSPTVQ